MRHTITIANRSAAAASQLGTIAHRLDAMALHASTTAAAALMTALVTGLVTALAAAPAVADFRICNLTKSRVGIALGYKDPEGWATEGWWNLPTGNCETLLRGSLAARFYYIYAIDYDRGGEWSGPAFMCTRDKEFTIRGTGDCLARGFDRTGFFEVDTGEQQTWTVQLTETGETAQRPIAPGQPAGPAPSTRPTAPPLPGNAPR
jgi:uncharacterized membrane protein